MKKLEEIVYDLTLSSGDWWNCSHKWIASGDLELGDVPGVGSRQEVKCKKCGCPGEMYNDGTVDWPTS
jgi:hypothetical protein